MLVVKGWTLLAHPLFLDQLDVLAVAIENERAKKPTTYRDGANAKLLTAILKLALDVIPDNPNAPDFRQGNTLGSERKHWFRAKFGSGRFRLFFRFNSTVKTVVYAWVNDAQTLRTYGSKTDAYKVFGRMLDSGNPLDDWNALLKVAVDPATAQRLANAVERLKQI